VDLSNAAWFAAIGSDGGNEVQRDDRLNQLADAVLKMDRANVEQFVEAALEAGIAPVDIVGHGLSLGMRQVGDKFRDGDIFMPEVLVSCDVYYAGLKLVQPLIEAAGTPMHKGKIVLGTIHGDVHTVGKDVAAPVFRAAGFEVVDLGTDVPDDTFVDAIRKHQPDIVGLGTYMTSTFMHTAETVRTIERAELRSRVKIICGGPAVDARAARKMGADDAVDDAWEGVARMEQWMEGAAR
jgi:5-methyltetrahydrofolate--homocysteine methyltransferase